MSTEEALPTQPEIVIVEPSPLGHRLLYIRHIALAVGDERWVWFSSEAAVKSRERNVYLDGVRPHSISTMCGSRRKLLKSAVNLARSVGARRVIVPDGDKYLAALLLLSHSWKRSSPDLSVLLMRTDAPLGRGIGAWRLRAKLVAAWAANKLSNVQLRFLTDGFGLAQSRRGYKSISPAQDPVDVPAQVQGNSGSLLLPDEHLSIGILGGIDLRKNPSVLVEAAAALENVVVVLAGRLSPEVRALASTNRSWLELRKAGRLVEINGLLTSEEFDGLLKQLTAVAILHDNDAPSGILCEAAARGTPAIVASGGWLEQIVATLQFGVATEISVEGVKETLESFGVREAEFKSNAAQAAHRLGTDAFVRALLN